MACTTMQSQNAVTAYFSTKQLLPFVFAKWYIIVESQNEVATYFSSKQLLPFGFAGESWAAG